MVANLEAQLLGSEKSEAAVVVGSHYDSVGGTVGANDNASGVAATLELARLLKGNKLHRTVRFVFFVNEEPPYFQTECAPTSARRYPRGGDDLAGNDWILF